MNLSMLFQIMGGIGLFLYGIKLMGDALQDLAGDKMRTLVGQLTSTPLKGVLVGTLVTMVIQSSSATTIMTVSFVQAGLMTLRQALGVIMGANVGTTVTAQLVAFNMKELALPLLGIGMALAVFGRSQRQRYIGNAIFGFGLLFVGMRTMEGAMSFLADNKDFFLRFSSSPLLCVFAGTVLTMVVQSSSATVGLTIAMAVQGLLPLNSAIAILFGDNIGTTITAIIASLGSNRAAKQAATGHVLFNLIGVAIFLPFLSPYANLVAKTAPGIARQLANAHTIFNLANTIIQMPFIGLIEKLITKIIPVPAPQKDDVVYSGPRYLDEMLLSTSPAAAVTAVRSELIEMGKMAYSMLANAQKAFASGDNDAARRVSQTEDNINDLTRKIAAFAAKLWQRHISSDLSTLLEAYVNGSGDIERIGDHAQNIIEAYNYLHDHDQTFSQGALDELNEMFAAACEMLDKALSAISNESPQLALEVAKTLEPKVDSMEKLLRHRHILRLNSGDCSATTGVLFVDLISNLERVGDHATNLAEIVLAQRGYATGEETAKTFDDD